MMKEDYCIGSVSEEHIGTEEGCFVSEDRLQAYRALLKTIDVFIYRGYDDDRNCEIYFSLVERGNVTAYDAKGVAYCPDGPANLQPDLTEALGTLQKGQYGYRPIVDDWYLYAIWG
ncbi:hypothetical protein ABI59_09580 [Acidobacteria bacterium Mor1]|nr:hypothetical protein ABI59_09580 [Acidobacteria bacterium Mor1]